MLLILFFQIVILKFLKIFCLVLWFKKKKIVFLFAHSKVIKMFFIFFSLEANCFTFYI